MADPSNIDKLAGNINEVVHAMRQIAPEVWAAARRQVLLENSLWVVLWCICAIVVWRVVVRQWPIYWTDPKSDDNDRYRNRDKTPTQERALIMLFCAALVGLIIAAEVLVAGPAVITEALNPDYAAAKLLISTVTK